MSLELPLVGAFEGIHRLLAAERRLEEAGWRPELVPAPAAISADCGYVLVLRPRRQAHREGRPWPEAAERALREAGALGIWVERGGRDAAPPSKERVYERYAPGH